ncbi:phosphatase PAP2 family protein [Phyllobacterium pellucidum]|uniref:phosphatase PAP2 family protein n=1 Tax=Phyllobacterium pellucidum TaxID=2740464 RepID=UPI001D13EEF9|nr:phosphatase PAP2 family protein [Phyllobacterium sp. T1018]UGY10192.1 phosphatase PAP2 family protein [Phyllobacterium sp. T1018]
MISRRTLIKAISGLVGTASVARTAVVAAREHHFYEDEPWRISDDFYFRKTVRASGNGIPALPFPVHEIKRAVWKGGEEAFEFIRSTFEEYNAAPVDPGGALLKLPAYATDLVKRMAAPPMEGSSGLAGEMLELYWCAALRDIEFDKLDFGENGLAALSELKGLGLYARGSYACDRLFGSPWWNGEGSFVSAFLLANIPRWPVRVQQSYPSFRTGEDFGSTRGEWERMQSGEVFPTKLNELTGEPDVVRTGRRLATLVYQDYPTQIFDNTAIQLNQIRFRVFRSRGTWGFQKRYTPFNFGGLPDLMCHVATACKIALDACWLAKWGMFFYPRPEEIAEGIVSASPGSSYEALEQLIVRSTLFRKAGAVPFLSQAYPDGAPVHPSYPAGHAVIAGAAVTVMKAYIRPNAELPSGFVDWKRVGIDEPMNGLQVVAELDKLAWNVGVGRCFAGVHFRSDIVAGLELGEAIALSYFAECKKSFPALVAFTIQKFNGEFVYL